MTFSKKNIILIGMPGSGKSSVAKEIKNILQDYKLIETDEEIEKQENKSIEEIFEQSKEEYFREKESEIIKKISKNFQQICSTGGGSVIKEKNLKNLKENGVVFYLEANVNEIFERIKKEKQRPILNKDFSIQTLEKLEKQRLNAYKKANYTINTENRTTKEIAEEIVRKYENDRRKN